VGVLLAAAVGVLLAAAEIGAAAIAEQQALGSSTRRTTFELRVNIM
jgi:hypothetical protein